jgi:hypothetical protein
MGNLFQISNQTTLGEKEEEIISRLSKVIETIIEKEHNARQVLLQKKPNTLLDRFAVVVASSFLFGEILAWAFRQALWHRMRNQGGRVARLTVRSGQPSAKRHADEDSTAGAGPAVHPVLLRRRDRRRATHSRSVRLRDNFR